VAAGLLLAGAGSRLLESQLFGVRPLEPWTYAGVSLLLGVASVAACLVPARRATRVDPLAALRAD
jgi:ABC-type antimicrobial peptide transport system permease subunit